MKYRAEIDGLRAVAVIPVILFHAGFSAFSGGFLGVDIFFVISGFLIGGIIFSQLEQGTFSILHFYDRRARRILPALVVVCAAASVAAWFWLSPKALSDFGLALRYVFLFISNVFFWQSADYFATDSAFNPLLHTWSLAVEEQYYLFFPLVMWVLMRYARKALVPVLAVTLVLSLALAHRLSLDHVDAAFFLIPTRAWELLAGSLLAITLASLPRGEGAVTREIPGLLGLAMCLVSFATFDETVRHPSLYTLVPVAGTVLILGWATADTLTGRLLSNRLLVGIGLISYSLYLYHQPVFAFLRIRLARDMGPEEFIVPILVCFALSYLTWRFVEQPFRNRQMVSVRWLVGLLVPAVLGLIGVGIFMPKYSDSASRISPDLKQVFKEMETVRKEREAGVRLGRCHTNWRSVDVATFLSKWDCMPEASNPSILVFGDSHSADKAWALRSAGAKFGNLGGAGCPLLPVAKNPFCAELNKKALEIARSGKIDGLVLAQRWDRRQVTDAELEKLFAYWKDAGVPILLFMPMPEFSRIKEKMWRIGHAGKELDSITYDAALLKDTADPLRAAAAKAGFDVVETRDLFCGTSDGGACPAFADNHPLLVDYGHLSTLGAQRFGAAVLGSTAWKDWVAKLTHNQVAN